MNKSNFIALIIALILSLPFTYGGCSNSSSSGGDGETLAVFITAPNDDDAISGLQTVSADIESIKGIRRVEFYLLSSNEPLPLAEWVDRSVHTGSGTWNYEQSLDTADYADGECIVRVVAYDLIGNSAEDEVIVTTYNVPIFEEPFDEVGEWELNTYGDDDGGSAYIEYGRLVLRSSFNHGLWEGWADARYTDDLIVSSDDFIIEIDIESIGGWFGSTIIVLTVDNKQFDFRIYWGDDEDYRGYFNNSTLKFEYRNGIFSIYRDDDAVPEEFYSAGYVEDMEGLEFWFYVRASGHDEYNSASMRIDHIRIFELQNNSLHR